MRFFKILLVLPLIAVMLSASPAQAEGFSFTFEWGDIPSCDTGSPNTVPNPIFTFKNLPSGTKIISMNLIDPDASNYDHGGGEIKYSGQDVIQPGAFEYKSPCPPSGVHNYEWTAWALDKNEDSIGGPAKSTRDYPEK